MSGYLDINMYLQRYSMISYSIGCPGFPAWYTSISKFIQGARIPDDQNRLRYRSQYRDIPISGHLAPISAFGNNPDACNHSARWIIYFVRSNSRHIFIRKAENTTLYLWKHNLVIYLVYTWYINRGGIYWCLPVVYTVTCQWYILCPKPDENVE